MISTPPTHHPREATIREFVSALFDKLTYSPWKNLDFIFGFLWGIPVPIFTALIHWHASMSQTCVTDCMKLLFTDPHYIFFLLHPLMFAIVFGALGTMRARRDEQIRLLVGNLEKHCDELGKANDKLTEVDRLKSEFLANVTHELKSPLVTALGYTDRMLGGHLGDVNERQRKGLEVGKRNLIRLRGLIDEILDFSRLDAGVAKFEMVPVNLSSAVESAVENLAIRAKDSGLRLTSNLPKDPATVLGDQHKLMQIVINLVDNAIKHSPAGSEIRVELTPDFDTWHMKVIDHGSGIAADMIPKLFERFFQVDGSLARKDGGVGLGLVIVKKIIEAHKGRIWMESQIGAGTTVHVLLPVLKADKPAGENVKTEEVTHVAVTAD